MPLQGFDVVRIFGLTGLHNLVNQWVAGGTCSLLSAYEPTIHGHGAWWSSGLSTIHLKKIMNLESLRNHKYTVDLLILYILPLRRGLDHGFLGGTLWPVMWVHYGIYACLITCKATSTAKAYLHKVCCRSVAIYIGVFLNTYWFRIWNMLMESHQ